MALEQVLSDRDSEDEGDDDIADLEDRRVNLKNLSNPSTFSLLFPFLHIKIMYLDLLLLAHVVE